MNLQAKNDDSGQFTDITVDQFVDTYEKMNVAPLTIEGRIIFYLTKKGKSRIKEVMIASRSSYRGFYLALGKLKSKGVVHISDDPGDKRARLVQLSAPEKG